MKIKNYDKVIELAPSDYEAIYARGNSYYYLKDYQNAIKNYTQTIYVKPNYARAYYARALAYELINKHKKAVSDSKKYKELTGKNGPYMDFK